MESVPYKKRKPKETAKVTVVSLGLLAFGKENEFDDLYYAICPDRTGRRHP